jgi:hypothetical protein
MGGAFLGRGRFVDTAFLVCSWLALGCHRLAIPEVMGKRARSLRSRLAPERIASYHPDIGREPVAAPIGCRGRRCGENSMTRFPGRSVLLFAVAMTTLVLAACTTHPTSTASSSPDPATAFLAIAHDSSFSGSYSATLSAKYGGQTESISGNGVFSGDDSHDTGTVHIGASTRRIEDITANGSDYEKDGNGPWLEAPNSHIYTILQRLSTLDDLGTATISGQSLHHLRSPGGFALLPSDLGLQDQGIHDLHGSLDIYVEDDGTPVELKITTTWTGPLGQASATETLDLTDIGSSVAIEAPSDVWTTFSSSLYSIAHPPSFSPSKKGAWEYLSDPSGFRVGITSGPLPSGTTLADLTRGEIASDSPTFGKPESVQKGTVGGEPATLVTYHASLQGTRDFIVVALTIHGDTHYGAFWISRSGSESRDRNTFLEMLSSFQFSSTPVA